MAVILMLDFDNEDEAFEFQNNPHLVAVYKRPTLFCEGGPECRLYEDGYRRGIQSALRKWYICKACGRYIVLKIHKDFISNMDSWTRWHHNFGRNILDTFKKASIGDKL